MGKRSVSSRRVTSTTTQKTKGLTHLQSLNVIRNMIRVSVSEICYLRNLFPEAMFKERVYADMNVKCLAPIKETASQETDDAFLITQWLEDGVFDALDKKYLDSLVLCIYSISAKSQPEQLLESYTYTIKHATNGSPELATSFTGAKALNCSAENVKAQTVQLIRSLVSITNNLDPLPRNRLITMKVFFNDTCPADWQPKHFKTATAEYSNQVKAPSLKLDVGRVITPHHFVTMELEMAEEYMESLSQVGLKSGLSENYAEPDDDSDATTMEGGDPTAQQAIDPVEVTPEKAGKGVISRPVQVTPLQEVTRDEFLAFLLSSSIVERHRITARFPTQSSEHIERLLVEFQNAGVIRQQQGSHQFGVAVYNCDLVHRAIHETHGKLKREITAEALAHALQTKTVIAEAILARMEQEKLVVRGVTGFEVVFSEANRPFVRKALQAAKALSIAPNEPSPTADTNGSIYDFEPAACTTPTHGSKHKSSTSSVSSVASTTRSQRSVALMGSCADYPILQVRKALKKRKVAVPPIS